MKLMIDGIMYSGSSLPRMSLQLACADSLHRALPRHTPPDSELSAMIAPSHNDRLMYRRMRSQHGFDFAELDSEAANLDLLISPPDEVDFCHRRGIEQDRQCDRACRLARIKPVRDKPFGCELRPPPVAARYPVAADIELACSSPIGAGMRSSSTT